MSEAVYQVMTMLSTLVTPLPMGTNLGLLHLLWMLVSGRLLASRGALFPALQETGLSAPQVRRAWAALTSPGWSSDALIQRWAQQVAHAGRWQAHRHGGYQPVAVDLTGFWRPRLHGLPDHPLLGRSRQSAACHPHRPDRPGRQPGRPAGRPAAGAGARRPD